ncbi:hypothetical protein CJD36_017510 [Flavipsychrobacter stenotrophus]|uniref:Secretion system C-terminal sorting domain-containing protein n=1 Tax=Flavipsychrobacter stenotrophus TaxID=2077091 RepID=A0A2S7SSZ5_9BACT|nr:SBBP repeat-containing protein [Flavipsychrobacter stenotrophus]PQJ09727.1 hypothetical protein CJD36_017510 [Flavipsychrobacter stenotrophus]
MKRAFIIFASLFLVFVTSSALMAQNWQWGKAGGSNGYDRANSVATDPSGNVYVAGHFDTSSITFGGTTLYNASTRYWDIFLVKYSPGGNVIWAKSFGGLYDDDATAVATDQLGNVYIAGSFYSPTMAFGTSIISNVSLNGSSDIFIAKFDENGANLWAKGIGSRNVVSVDEWDYATALATDSHNNVFMAGYYSDSIRFGTFWLRNSFPATGDGFIVKYDESGTAQWVNDITGIGEEKPAVLAVDQFDDVYVAGSFSSTSMVVSGTWPFTCSGNTDGFIAKYSNAGAVLWANKMGEAQNDNCYGLATDKAGNVYVGGTFNSPYMFCDSRIVYGHGYAFDMFLAKFSPTGTVRWAKGIGGLYEDFLYSIAIDSFDIYITGCFISDTIVLGPSRLITTSKSSFIGKFDTSGNAIWGKVPQGSPWSNSCGYSLAVDNFSNVYIAGDYGADSLVFGGDRLTSVGGVEDVFLAKLGQAFATGIDETVGADERLNVYPNPASNQVTIVLKLSSRYDRLLVTDQLGRKVYDRSVDSSQNEATIDVSGFAKGIYIVNAFSSVSIDRTMFVVD